jgi:hypothetical protein
VDGQFGGDLVVAAAQVLHEHGHGADNYAQQAVVLGGAIDADRHGSCRVDLML